LFLLFTHLSLSVYVNGNVESVQLSRSLFEFDSRICLLGLLALKPLIYFFLTWWSCSFKSCSRFCCRFVYTSCLHRL